MHLAQPTGLARVPSHQSLSFALRNQTGRANQGRWAAVPSKCGRRQRPFELVSCRFRVEIGARSVPWLHCRPTAPFVSRRRAANGPRRARAAPPPNAGVGGGRPPAKSKTHRFDAASSKCMILKLAPLLPDAHNQHTQPCGTRPTRQRANHIEHLLDRS